MRSYVRHMPPIAVLAASLSSTPHHHPVKQFSRERNQTYPGQHTAAPHLCPLTSVRVTERRTVGIAPTVAIMSFDTKRHRPSNQSPQRDPISSLFSSSTNGRHSSDTRGEDIDRQAPRSTRQHVPDIAKRHARPQHEESNDDDDLEFDDSSDILQNDRRRRDTGDVARHRPDASSRHLPTANQAPRYDDRSGTRHQPIPHYALSSSQSAPRHITVNSRIRRQDEDEIETSGRYSDTPPSEYSRSLPSRDRLITTASSPPGQGLRRGSSVRDDRSQGSVTDRQRHGEYSTSPPSSYPKKLPQLNDLSTYLPPSP